MTRIVHVSDLHLGSGEWKYAGLSKRLELAAESIRSLAPDAVVITGDLTDTGSADPSDFDLARAWVDSLAVPALLLPGNHDLGANRLRGEQFPATERFEDVRYAETGWARAFGLSPVTRLDVGSVTILGFALRDGDPDGALTLLAETAANVPPHRTLMIAGHYPAVMPRDVQSIEAFGARGYIDSSVTRLTEVLVASRAVAYLCGHVHLTSATSIVGGPVQVTAGGLGPGQCAARVFDVRHGEMHCSTIELEGPQNFWETVPEAQDAAFSRGTRQEQSFVVSASRVSEFEETRWSAVR